MARNNARAKLAEIRKNEAARLRRRRLIGFSSGAAVLVVVALIVTWAVSRTSVQPSAASALVT
jgi:predicted esterase